MTKQARTTVSGLSPELKAEAKRLGINISQVTRDAVRREIMSRRIARRARGVPDG